MERVIAWERGLAGFEVVVGVTHSIAKSHRTFIGKKLNFDLVSADKQK